MGVLFAVVEVHCTLVHWVPFVEEVLLVPFAGVGDPEALFVVEEVHRVYHLVPFAVVVVPCFVVEVPCFEGEVPCFAGEVPCFGVEVPYFGVVVLSVAFEVA